MVKTAPAQSQQFYAGDREIWREWLQKNHTKTKNVWLILYHKHSGKPSVTYQDAVEEALCFGWIDSRSNKRDDESSYLFFARRSPKSTWSKKNRERAERMISAGLMTSRGMEMITIAKNTGRWTALAEVQNSIITTDLKEALAKKPIAEKNFSAFTPSSKRIILEWILKRQKTKNAPKTA
jgi:uncharacterized protein YdeI (YjbR/CyaY-like superfamily)